MNAITLATGLVERTPIPDSVVRLGIAVLCERTNRKLAAATATVNRDFAASTVSLPIAEHVADANTQHYEVPAAFFEAVLGPQRKYSCCVFNSLGEDLAAAEERALVETAAHAGLADGQAILDLGCGWGALSLWMARHYPMARILAVSNSHSLREYIARKARTEGLTNLYVVTADMNVFSPKVTFDRIVSVEMFEHMLNWRRLLGRVRSWLKPDGRFFMHVFTHDHAPYRFDHRNTENKNTQHNKTNNNKPSQSNKNKNTNILAGEEDWRWSGTHY